MEPLESPPAIEYVIAGADAERICARGFVALIRDAALDGTGARTEGDLITVLHAGMTWRITRQTHPSHPAVILEIANRTRTLCAYGRDGFGFARAHGFTPSQIEVRTGRFAEESQ